VLISLLIIREYFNYDLPLKNKMVRLFNPENKRNKGLLGERSEINMASQYMILNSPNSILIGNGVESYPIHSINYIYMFTDRVDIINKNMEAHNKYAEIIFEFGLIGLLIFVLILYVGFRNFYRLAILALTKNYKIVFLAHGLLYFYIYYLVMLYFGYGWIFHLFLILSISQISNKIRNDKIS